MSPTPRPGLFESTGNGATALPMDEPQSGRVMLGVGVNGNAGVVGGITLDEVAVGEQIAVLKREQERWAASVGPQHPQRKYIEERLKNLEDVQRRQSGEFNTEAYAHIVENPFLKTVDAPLSTFSIDVDTASYSNARRFLNGGQLPPPDAVRLEEFINYFTYDYPQPSGDDPFAVTTEAARCPWNGEHVLVRVGLKGKEIHRKERPATNLVFLIDVSGSMQSANKLPLVRESLKLLVNELGDSDCVAIVVYAGSTGLVLPSTGGDRKQTILEAIDRLQSGGSTNGGAGITLAYQTAVESFIKGGVNRVVLATDGDFNVGVTNQGDLVRLIEEKAKSGVFFSALGYGMGNLKDSTLEKLADKGNGNYAYIDTLAEAKKVLVEQMSGTLVTIAKDVKVQIEFNPTRVAAYRLLGYENRVLAAQDFNDDKKDAGEIGAGHTVTALYELIPAGTAAAKETKKLPTVDPLKYQQPTQTTESTEAAKAAELLTLKLRYKQPDGDKSKLIERPLADDVRSYAQASRDFKFAASVTAFGMMLRNSQHKGSATYDAVLELAGEGIGADRGGYRAEFVELVRKARDLAPRASR
jgi:Ca-activated chloride channel family protein